MKNSRKLSLVLMWAAAISVRAEVVTDGTLGAVQSLSNQMIIPQSLGTTVGNNLFHSFQTFNINTGESATFTGSATLQNVISRVTGGQVSTIDGLLKSEVGNANFYFINPAGVTFGVNAKVDVPAAFHVSTANSLHFSNGDSFSSSLSTPSQLSIAEPISFGFLGNQTGNIEINGSKLSFHGNQISLSAKNLRFNQAQIINPIFHHEMSDFMVCDDLGNCSADRPPGMLFTRNLMTGLDMRLSAIGSLATEINLHQEITHALTGELTLDNSQIDVSGDGAGYLQLNAGNIYLINNSSLLNHNFSDNNASSEHSIKVVANNLTLDNSQIKAETAELGRGADIDIQLSNQLTVNNSGQLNVDEHRFVNFDGINYQYIGSTYGNPTAFYTEVAVPIFYPQGQIGNINIQAKSILLDNGFINSGSYAGAIGQAKDLNSTITINADQLKLINQSKIESKSTIGNAANLVFNVHDISLDNSSILSSVLGQGYLFEQFINPAILFCQYFYIDSSMIHYDKNKEAETGKITVNSQQLSLLNQSAIHIQADIETHTNNINISANKILMDNSTLNINTNDLDGQSSAENSGSVLIRSVDLTLTNQSTITSTVSENAPGLYPVLRSAYLKGNGNKLGVIDITTKRLAILDNSGISSSTTTLANSGDIFIQAKDVLMNNGYIYTDSSFNPLFYYLGSAGYISIKAEKSITLGNQSRISSNTSSTGAAGHVTLNSPNIVIDNSSITAEATTDYFSLERNYNDLHSAVDCAYLDCPVVFYDIAIGNIDIQADLLSLSHQAKISIQNDISPFNVRNVEAGKIGISANQVDLKDSIITAQSTGNMDAGSIHLSIANQLSLDPSFITTAAAAGNGGDIFIHVGNLINLQDSGFLTSVTGATGNGGNINVSANSLIMDNGVIQANAVAGSGGEINLNLKTLISNQNQLIKGGAQVIWQPFIEGFNLIQAASASGINGSVNISSPQFNISGSISGLDSAALALPIIDHNFCQATALYSSSLTGGSKGGIPDDGLEFGFVPAMDMQNVLQQAQDIMTIYSTNAKVKSPSCAALKI